MMEGNVSGGIQSALRLPRSAVSREVLLSELSNAARREHIRRDRRRHFDGVIHFQMLISPAGAGAHRVHYVYVKR